MIRSKGPVNDLVDFLTSPGGRGVKAKIKRAGGAKLLERDGARLSGDYAGEAFHLLLKLLAAGDSLSVQVHPDDAYAREHEGKLGKTEAWVILKAEEGASIL